MKKLLFFFMSIVLLLPTAVSAQTQEQIEQMLSMQLPLDKGTKVGKLPNGLTYYIRHNEKPQGQAFFYIAQKVGSVLEEDDQRGLAHFLEHMCFNGTENFPGDALLRYLESVGVKFGQQLNAYTAVDETVYNIDNVPTAREATIDSVLLILHDWSHNLTLDPKEIDKERGVIHEEWRMRSSAQMRIYERQLPTLLSNSRPGNRLPIGTMEVVDNFKPAALRAYYEKWYRPDLQAIIVVGDLDVERTEKKIVELFSPIPMPANPAERVYYDVPDNNEPIVCCDKDKEQQVPVIMINNKHEDFIPGDKKNTIAGIMAGVAKNAAIEMLNNRVDELSLDPNAPFIQAGMSDGDFILSKVTKAFATFIVPKEGQTDEAVKAVMAEVYRAAKHGFTDSELARYITEFDSKIESLYQNRDKRESTSFIAECKAHFLEQEAMPGLEVEYPLYKQVLPQIPLAYVNQVMKELVSVSDTNLVVLASCPDKEGFVQPTPEQLLADIHATQQMDLEPYVDNVKNEPLIPELPTPGTIVSETEGPLGFTELTLSNGVKVAMKQTDFKDNEVLMRAYSDGGTGRYPDADAPTLQLIDNFVGMSGLGNFTSVELQKALAGIQAGVSASMSSRSEYLRGNAVPKDLRTLFELTYLHFQPLKRDDKAVGSLMQQLGEVLRNRATDPDQAYSDSMQTTIYGHHPRLVLMSPEMLGKLSYDRALEIYQDRYADASDFTFVFVGNFDADSLRAYAQQYLATLPVVSRDDKAVDSHFGLKKGVRTNVFEREQEQPKCMLTLFQFAPCKNTVKNNVTASIFGQALSMRLLEIVREEMSAAYSIGASAGLSMQADGSYVTTLYVQAPLKPEMCDSALLVINAELEQAAKKGIDDKYVSKVKEYMLKSYKESLRQNGTWLSYYEALKREGTNSYAEFEKTVQAISNKDLKAIAKMLLKSGNKDVIIMKPVQQ